MTIYCSQQAQADAAPLYGTIGKKSLTWLMIEYNGEWGHKAVESAVLPPSVRQWLNEQGNMDLNLRTQFIKKSTSTASQTAYIAIPNMEGSTLYKFELDGLESLLDLYLPDYVAGETRKALCDEKLVLVCTNGKHDRCCAKFGLPVYDALAKERDLSVWQTTHTGGHRYAATTAIFPSGIFYGYLSPDNAPTLADHIRTDNIYLPSYRGRTFYAKLLNAADYFLRRAIGETSLTTPKVTKEESDENGRYRIHFDHTHIIELTETYENALASCDKPPKPAPQFQFVKYEIA